MLMIVWYVILFGLSAMSYWIEQHSSTAEVTTAQMLVLENYLERLEYQVKLQTPLMNYDASPTSLRSLCNDEPCVAIHQQERYAFAEPKLNLQPSTWHSFLQSRKPWIIGYFSAEEPGSFMSNQGVLHLQKPDNLDWGSLCLLWPTKL